MSEPGPDQESVCDHPHQPEYGDIVEQLEKRGLSRKNERFKLDKIARHALPSNTPDCMGQLDIGFFFDGTNNNKEKDYGPEEKPLPFLSQQHSNVVRLYPDFQDEKR